MRNPLIPGLLFIGGVLCLACAALLSLYAAIPAAPLPPESVPCFHTSPVMPLNVPPIGAASMKGLMP